MTHKLKVKGDKGWIKEEKAYAQAIPNLKKKRDEKNEDPMTHPSHKELKRAVEYVEGPNKPADNGKRMNTKQATDSCGSEARVRIRHHPLVPNQYRGSRP